MSLRIPVQRDARGAYLTVGFEQAADVRAALSRGRLAFDEEGDDGCGCGGPVLAIFRLRGVVEASALDLDLELDERSSGPAG